MDDFLGAKLAIFLGDDLLVYLRDDRSDIPFPAMWDLAGGGREDAETPETCALRESKEEFGLQIAPEAIVWKRSYPSVVDPGRVWFFVTHLPAQIVDDVVFGDEGQHWRLMTAPEFINYPDGVPHLQRQLQDYFDQR